MTGKQGTALGVARARFVDGLPRKAKELKGAIALLTGSPDSDRPREELRRRLHALYASAQVFRIEALASALKENIQVLDASREASRAVSHEELDNLAHLASTLPVLGGRNSSAPRPSSSGAIPSTPGAPVFPPPARLPGPPVEEGSAAKRLRSRRATHQGLAPSRPPPPRPSSIPPRRPSFTAGTSRGSGRPSTMPGAPLEMIVSVLVLDGIESQTKIRDDLPKDRYELLAASDPEEALRLARSSAPDIVLVAGEVGLRDGVDLISRLRSDPLTDFVPVVLLHPAGDPISPEQMRDHGADAVFDKGSEPPALRRLIDKIVGGDEAGPTGDVVGDATLEEVAERLAKEIHRGIVEAAAAGKDVKIALGDGSELLAAAWATIARVRAELAERSGGQIRFRDGAARGGPAFMSLVDEGIARAASTEDVSLRGRRVIVADDDPAVVWFFAGLLREEGALVAEVEDGLQALDAARKRRPDVILSDILMPRMDGLALCRELRRDPALAEVPVILLSWKEDFLQRMRELQAGASGYLRKEAASAQILHKVREVLRPRARLEAQLRAGGEVRGRIEGLGVLPLITTICDARPDARVTVRDAWNLFEIDLRDGEVADVTRTATDGSFSRGERALPQLLGMGAGRFTVGDSDGGPVRSSMSKGAEASLQDAVQKLGAFVDSVSGARLAKVATVKFDDDLVGTFLRTSPGEARALVERIKLGEKPRDLLVSGEVAPQALETALVDLARRGAILAVRDEEGGDLVAGALEARIGDRGPGLDWLESEESTGDIVRQVTSSPEPEHELGLKDEKTRREDEPLGLVDAPTTEIDKPLGLVEETTQEVEFGDLEEVPSPDEASDPESDAMLRAPTNPPPPMPDSDADAEAEAHPKPEEAAESKPKKTKKKKKKKKPEPEQPEGEPEDEAADTVADVQAPPQVTAPPAPAEDGGLSFPFIMAIAIAAAIGFLIIQMQEDSAPTPEPDEPEPVVQVDPEPEPTEPDEPETEPARSEHTLSFGQDMPRLLDTNVDVGPGQGILMVQAAGDGGEVSVEIRVVGAEESRDVGTAPVGVALDEGQYELVFRGPNGERVRYAHVRDGHTRVVRPD